MEIRQLSTFRTVAELGNFTRAAERLGYVQSNVTAHVQALERELGVVLFDRLGRQVRLTLAGRRLLDYAGRILALADEASNAVNDTGAGEVRISAPDTLCAHRLPALLRLVRSELPLVRVFFRPVSAATLRQQVWEGELDVAFTLEPSHPTTGLHVEALAHEAILLVASPEHALVGAAAVAPADLIGAPVLLTEAGCAYRVSFEQALAAAGVTLRETLEFSSVEAIKQCVIAGMGVAVLPAVTVARELSQGELAALNWVGPSLTMTTQMIWHAKRWCGPTLSAFLALARQALIPVDLREQLLPDPALAQSITG
jgi:DNA-binding transcriptional LysR family regulator